jgi:hypothetical protein
VGDHFSGGAQAGAGPGQREGGGQGVTLSIPEHMEGAGAQRGAMDKDERGGGGASLEPVGHGEF